MSHFDRRQELARRLGMDDSDYMYVQGVEDTCDVLLTRAERGEDIVALLRELDRPSPPGEQGAPR